MSRTIGERSNSAEEFYRRMLENWSSNLRVAVPGIIQEFNPATQTATVQVAIREKIRNNDLSEQWLNIPLLLDVPVVLPRAGVFILTMPIKKGDECLILFADMCIDAWFSNGGIQNQIEKRRHDLSDAFAIIGVWSQPRKVLNYASDSVQLRTEETDPLQGAGYIELKYNKTTKKSTINLVADYINTNRREV